VSSFGCQCAPCGSIRWIKFCSGNHLPGLGRMLEASTAIDRLHLRQINPILRKKQPQRGASALRLSRLGGFCRTSARSTAQTNIRSGAPLFDLDRFPKLVRVPSEWLVCRNDGHCRSPLGPFLSAHPHALPWNLNRSMKLIGRSRSVVALLRDRLAHNLPAQIPVAGFFDCSTPLAPRQGRDIRISSLS
jgi:hypothetical protein